MEGANESARHAVNAILKDYCGKTQATIEPCEIWPIEEREVDDFDFLRELDAILYERDLDHFLEILDLPELARTSWTGSTTSKLDPQDPLAALDQLNEIFKKYGTGLIDMIRKES
jgi:hypothetical protein